MPQLLDPNFHQSVILLCEHGASGAFGLVLNRPTEEPVEDHLPDWAPITTEPAVVFVGGPVSNEIAPGSQPFAQILHRVHDS